MQFLVRNSVIANGHAHPEQSWSVKQLAETVALSPSRFAARFSTSLGERPMAYVNRWRMNIACRQFTPTQAGIETIAANVGYEGAAAFSRAFKKHTNISPAAWRKRQLP